jgi:hypothetical protein
LGASGSIGQREVGDVVDDADGELALGLVLLELVVDGEGCRRRLVLGAQAVAAAGHGDVRAACLVQSGDDILVERLADGAGLLGAVEDGDLLDGLGQAATKCLMSNGRYRRTFTRPTFSPWRPGSR